MAKPAIFQWSTNANYATGPAVGTPTKIAPSAGQIQDGFVPTTAAIPQHVNFCIDALADWAVTYLNNLHAETDFTGQSIAWGGNNTHAGSEVFNGTATFNSTFSVPGTATIGTVAATTVNATTATITTANLTTANVTTLNCTGPISNSGGDVSIVDNLTVDGTGYFDDDLTVSGDVSAAGSFRFVSLNNANHTYGHHKLKPPVTTAGGAATFDNQVGYLPTLATWRLLESAQYVIVPMELPNGSAVFQVDVAGNKNATTNIIHSVWLVTPGLPNTEVQLGVNVTVTLAGDYLQTVYSGADVAVASGAYLILRMTSSADMTAPDSHSFYFARAFYRTQKQTEDFFVS